MFPVQVLSRKFIASDSILLRLARPGTQQAPAPYRPGQFVTLAFPAAHDTLYRSYPLGGDGDPLNPWEIAIKRQQMGSVSTLISQRIQIGSLIFASTPRSLSGLEHTSPRNSIITVHEAGGKFVTGPQTKIRLERVGRSPVEVTTRRRAASKQPEGPGLTRGEWMRLILLAFLAIFFTLIWALVAA
jgi:hypothetical protein